MICWIGKFYSVKSDNWIYPAKPDKLDKKNFYPEIAKRYWKIDILIVFYNKKKIIYINRYKCDLKI